MKKLTKKQIKEIKEKFGEGFVEPLKILYKLCFIMNNYVEEEYGIKIEGGVFVKEVKKL